MLLCPPRSQSLGEDGRAYRLTTELEQKLMRGGNAERSSSDIPEVGQVSFFFFQRAWFAFSQGFCAKGRGSGPVCACLCASFMGRLNNEKRPVSVFGKETENACNDAMVCPPP